MKTLAALVMGYTDSLLARAADATLKEGRPLIALLQETPLHRGHLTAMLVLAQAGRIVWPPLPDFSRRPRSIDALIDETAGRVLERVGFLEELLPDRRQTGPQESQDSHAIVAALGDRGQTGGKA
jgi:flavin prenyltransferase